MTDRIADSSAGVPQAERHVLGERGAPVTVVEYGDYECPYCAGAAPILRELVSTSQGRVRLVFRNFPLFEVHPHALTAALAAESTAASGESVFWAMHAKLFAHQARLSGPDLRLYAEAVGADPDLAVGDAAQQFAPIVQADYASGLEAGVCSHPDPVRRRRPLRRAPGPGGPAARHRPARWGGRAGPAPTMAAAAGLTARSPRPGSTGTSAPPSPAGPTRRPGRRPASRRGCRSWPARAVPVRERQVRDEQRDREAHAGQDRAGRTGAPPHPARQHAQPGPQGQRRCRRDPGRVAHQRASRRPS